VDDGHKIQTTSLDASVSLYAHLPSTPMASIPSLRRLLSREAIATPTMTCHRVRMGGGRKQRKAQGLGSQSFERAQHNSPNSQAGHCHGKHHAALPWSAVAATSLTKPGLPAMAQIHSRSRPHIPRKRGTLPANDMWCVGALTTTGATVMCRLAGGSSRAQWKRLGQLGRYLAFGERAKRAPCSRAKRLGADDPARLRLLGTLGILGISAQCSRASRLEAEISSLVTALLAIV
jgi:hypothetical protein